MKKNKENGIKIFFPDRKEKKKKMFSVITVIHMLTVNFPYEKYHTIHID